MTRRVVAVVPAAGAARRFGGGKLMADLHGRPLLDHTIESLLEGGVDRVVIVAPAPDAFSAVPAMADARVKVVVNPEPSRGMFSSIQCGLDAAGEQASWLAVLPADMPFVRAATVSRLIEAAGRANEVVVAACDGRRGHPLVLPARLRGPLLAQPASSSLKAALGALGAASIEVEVGDPGVVRDVDRRQDLPQSSADQAPAHE